MKRFIFSILFSLFFATSAIAATVTVLFWDAPTQWIDGSGLQPSDIAGYRVYCGKTSLAYNLATTVTGTTQVYISTAITSTQTNGKYYCSVTSFTTPSWGSVESAFSNEVNLYKTGSTFLSTPPVSQPPSNLQVR